MFLTHIIKPIRVGIIKRVDLSRPNKLNSNVCYAPPKTIVIRKWYCVLKNLEVDERMFWNLEFLNQLLLSLSLTIDFVYLKMKKY